MKTRNALLSVFGLGLMLCVNSVRAGQPPPIPAIYDGQLVTITVVNANVLGITHGKVASVADPIYFFPVDPNDPTGPQLQPHVIPTIPGVAGYNPHWDVKVVVVNNGRDLSTDPFVSEQEILDAANTYDPEIGDYDVTVTDLHFIVLCQVISLSYP
jgi:hypothetical protein